MAALHSSEVALDFQDALTDLQINNRYEISNLTIVAKENTEHAQAISQALEAHIKTVRFHRYITDFFREDNTPIHQQSRSCMVQQN